MIILGITNEKGNIVAKTPVTKAFEETQAL
jgi:hypothetical protein